MVSSQVGLHRVVGRAAPASVPLVQAAALMHPGGVPGREVRGTGPSLLPPHFHPTFLQAPCFITAAVRTDIDRPAVPRWTQACRKAKTTFPLRC